MSIIAIVACACSKRVLTLYSMNQSMTFDSDPVRSEVIDDATKTEMSRDESLDRKVVVVSHSDVIFGEV